MSQAIDDKLIARLQGEFRESLDSISEFDRARLRRARRNALAAYRPRRPWRHLALAASLALMALILLPMSTEHGPGTDPTQVANGGTTVSDLEILLAEEELRFYENLDFYVWLEAALPRERGNAD